MTTEPFQFLNEIQTTKAHSLSETPDIEKDYPPFFINRGLSQHLDTLFVANDMNQFWHVLENRLQYDYLFYSIKKRNRFGAWAKKAKNEDIDLVRKVYNCSYKKARDIIKILNTSTMKKLRERSVTGGIEKKKG
jgi:hypothetical protein